MLCIDNSGTRELKALHLVPQYQDQNNYLQSGTEYINKKIMSYIIFKLVSGYVWLCVERQLGC